MSTSVQKTQRAPFIKGLNGYRGLAVLGVILYHLFPAKVKGGYLGVVLFFTLSGYMLTDHFLLEFQQTGGFNIFQYLKKRLKSLYPILLVMFLFSFSYMTFFDRNLLVNSKEAFFSTITLTNNWWQILSGASYFDRYANPSPFTHLWFLGVIGQLYLLLPILLVLCETLFKKRRDKLIFIGGLSVISAILMAFLFHPENANRAYYGTDTRAFSFLIGMGLAYIWPSYKTRKVLNKKETWFLNGMGITSGLLLFGSYFVFSDHSLFVYRGGMFLYSLLAAFFLRTLIHQRNTFSQLFEGKFFNWLGSRSYGIYLFQFPLMVFYEEKVQIGNHPFINGCIELALILLLTEGAYRGLQLLTRSKNQKVRLASLAVVAFLGVTSVYGVKKAPEKTLKGNQGELEEVIKKNQELMKNKKTASSTTTEETTAKTTTSSLEKTTTSETSSSKEEEPKEAVPADVTPEIQALADKYQLSVEEVKKAQNLEFTAVGDSVLLSAAEYIMELFPKAYVDGKVGRQAYASMPTFNDLDSQGLLKPIVLVHLGTNGPFSKDQFDEVMTKLGDRKVFWMNCSAATVRWQNQVNSDLQAFKEGYKNLTLVDWFKVSNGKPDWFYDDQVHPNPTGAVYYVQTMAKALLK